MKKLVLKYFLSTINNKIVLLTHDFRKFCKYMPKMCKYTPKLCKCTPKKSLKYRSKNSKASSLKESNFWNANIVKTNTHTLETLYLPNALCYSYCCSGCYHCCASSENRQDTLIIFAIQLCSQCH